MTLTTSSPEAPPTAPPEPVNGATRESAANRASAQARSERVKLRRGLAFMGMTLVLPGSAQLAAGNKTVGRWALRTWLGLWALVALLALLGLLWRGGLFGLLTLAPTLWIVQVLLVAVGIGWAGLLIDAWRLARPPELARRHRPWFALISGVLVLAIVGGLVASASVVSAQRDLISSIFAGGGDQEVKAGRYNILLLGGDAGPGRDGLRPDSITVASVDAETGRTVLISLPRNMEDVPFPADSPLHARFPNGFGCPDHSCMLNAVYTYAMTHKDLYPGVHNPGAQATKEAVEGATGLEINYWTLIDMKGFEALIDAVGGVRITVNRRLPIGGHGTVYGYVEPGKDRLLDGRGAMWFARSRMDSSDYDRMARQKCVMNAMIKQLDATTVLTNFNKIADAGKEIVATDIPASNVNTLLSLALLAKDKPIASVAMVPPLVYPGSPDFAKVQATIAAKIAATEAADEPKPSVQVSQPAGASPVPSSSASSPKPKAAKSTPKPGQDTEDLGAVCSA